jgi:hypothetical protein
VGLLSDVAAVERYDCFDIAPAIIVILQGDGVYGLVFPTFWAFLQTDQASLVLFAKVNDPPKRP